MHHSYPSDPAAWKDPLWKAGSHSHSLQLATKQDKNIGKDLVARILPGDLVLCDIGYFSLNEFTHVENAEAWWLTRLPLNVGVLLKGSDPAEDTLKPYQKRCDRPSRPRREAGKALPVYRYAHLSRGGRGAAQGTQEESKETR